MPRPSSRQLWSGEHAERNLPPSCHTIPSRQIVADFTVIPEDIDCHAGFMDSGCTLSA
jgi:hypothetical protein